jgi:hypothetical protein
MATSNNDLPSNNLLVPEILMTAVPQSAGDAKMTVERLIQ